jgi:hypothetical protein
MYWIFLKNIGAIEHCTASAARSFVVLAIEKIKTQIKK